MNDIGWLIAQSQKLLAILFSINIFISLLRTAPFEVNFLKLLQGCYTTWRTRKSQDVWPKNQGKVRELENFNALSNFHANFKTKLLNIQSYIGTLNGLFLIFFVTKSQILVNITCNWNILVLSSNTILIVSPECQKLLRY